MAAMGWEEKLLTLIGGFLRVETEDGHIRGWGVSMIYHLYYLIMVRDMLTGRPINEELEIGGELH